MLHAILQMPSWMSAKYLMICIAKKGSLASRWPSTLTESLCKLLKMTLQEDSRDNEPGKHDCSYADSNDNDLHSPAFLYDMAPSDAR